MAISGKTGNWEIRRGFFRFTVMKKTSKLIHYSFTTGLFLSLGIWIFVMCFYSIVLAIPDAKKMKLYNFPCKKALDRTPQVISCGPKKLNIPEYEYYPSMVERLPNPFNLKSISETIKYPEIAIEKKIEGRVIAEIMVDSDGTVTRIKKITGDEVFHEEIRNVLPKLQFTAARKDNQPVKCWVTVPFNFKLKK